MSALLWILLFASMGVFAPAAVGASSRSHADANMSVHDRVIHVHMQSVLFRVMSDVVLQVDSLDGALAPSRKHEIVSLDDKNSFSFKVQQASTRAFSVMM